MKRFLILTFFCSHLFQGWVLADQVDDDYFACGLHEEVNIRGEWKFRVVPLTFDGKVMIPTPTTKCTFDASETINSFKDEEIEFGINLCIKGNTWMKIHNAKRKHTVSTSLQKSFLSPVGPWEESSIALKYNGMSQKESSHEMIFACVRATKSEIEKFFNEHSRWY